MEGISPRGIEPWVPPMVYGVTGTSDSLETKGQLSATPKQTTTSQDVVSKDTNVVPIPLSSSFFTSVLKEQGLPSFTQSIQSKQAVKRPNFDMDFYLPDGVATCVSKLEQHETDVVMEDDNPAIIIQAPTLESRYGTEYFALDKVNGQMYMVLPDDKWRKISAIAQKVSSYSMTPMRPSSENSQQTIPSLSGFKKTPNAESTRLPQQSSVLADTTSLDDQQMVAYFVEQTTKTIMQEILGKAQQEGTRWLRANRRRKTLS